jgi:hypothetical protein
MAAGISMVLGRARNNREVTCKAELNIVYCATTTGGGT